MTLPLDTFVTSVGSANIVGVYDPSYTAPTIVGGRATAQAPGAGAGPSVTSAGATGPTFAGGTAGLVFNSGDPDALSATSLSFDASGALTAFFFLQSATGLTEFAAGLGGRQMCVRINAFGNILHEDDTSNTLDSGVPLSGAPQVVTISKSATTNRKIKVGSAGEVSGTASAFSAGAQMFCFGDYLPNSFGFTGTIYVAGLLNFQATGGTHAAILAYFNAYFGIGGSIAKLPAPLLVTRRAL